MKNLISITLILYFISAQAQISNSIVDESLIENANTITLFDNTIFEVNDEINSQEMRHYKMIIVNNKSNEREIVLPYYDFSKIVSANVTLYDINGSKIESYNLNKFQDYSNKGYSVADDSRLKYLKISYSKYPFILEVQTKVNNKSSLFYPIWDPQPSEHHSVLESSFAVITDYSNTLRHKSILTSLKDSINMNDKYKLEWEVQNLKSFSLEDYLYDNHYYSPMVYLAPSSFYVDGYRGNMNSWQSFGEWSKLLMSDRYDFTEEDIKFFQNLTDSIEAIDGKVRAVYDYLQNSTRYVSIQLGVGGWQPFKASYVHEQKYGDCKALSFYTKSMLNAIGINSYYTQIYAGFRGSSLDENFPINRFNHAILTVPIEKDTIWLECTSQTNPYGYMGTFTSDRDAFLIDDKGNSKLIRTKVYDENDNVQTTLVKMKLDTEGNAMVSVNRIYQGIEIENDYFENVHLKIEKEKNEWFVDNHDWGAKSLKSLEITEPSDEPIPFGKMKAELEIRNAGKTMGKRVFYQPFIFTNALDMPTSELERKYPFENRYAYTQIDTIHVEFPEFFTPENNFKPVKLDTEFGTYESIMVQEQNHYTFIRKFVFYKGRYEPSKFEKFMEFVKAVKKGDKARLVLINKT